MMSRLRSIIPVVAAAVILLVLPPIVVQSTVRLATPYILGALAALIANRAGVFNLAIEGKMLLGAFVGAAVLYRPGLPPEAAPLDPLWGVLAAACVGALAGWLLVVMHLRFRADLVVIALAFNLLVASATVYAVRVWTGGYGALADDSITGLPVLSLPFIDGYNVLVYGSWLVVVVVWFMLYRTAFGRHLRATGENPDAALSAGINTRRIQTIALASSGALAGIAGAYLSLGVLSRFLDGMTAGRGWIAITVAIFAGNRPLPVLATALFFGFAESVSLYLDRTDALNIAPTLLQMVPQVATLAVLVLAALRKRYHQAARQRDALRIYHTQNPAE